MINQITIPTNIGNKKNIKTTFRSKGDNKVYHRGPNGWTYIVENKKVF
jgi:hypothetical protein